MNDLSALSSPGHPHDATPLANCKSEKHENSKKIAYQLHEVTIQHIKQMYYTKAKRNKIHQLTNSK